MNDAYLQEVEVLSHFAAGISQAGSSIADDARQVVSGAYAEMGNFQNKLSIIRSTCEKAEADYDYACSALEDARYAYDNYVCREDYSAAEASYLWQQVQACQTAVSVAKTKMEKARRNLQAGQSAVYTGEQILLGMISKAQTAGASIAAAAERVAAHVRQAAAVISQYNGG